MQPSSEPTQTIKYWQAIFGMKFANHLKKSTVKLISSAEREREREAHTILQGNLVLA